MIITLTESQIEWLKNHLDRHDDTLMESIIMDGDEDESKYKEQQKAEEIRRQLNG